MLARRHGCAECALVQTASCAAQGMHDRQQPLLTGAQAGGCPTGAMMLSGYAQGSCQLQLCGNCHMRSSDRTHLLQTGRVRQVALDQLCPSSQQLLCSRGGLVACEAPDLKAAGLEQCLQTRTRSRHCCCLQLGRQCPMHHPTHIGNTSTLRPSRSTHKYSSDGCHVCA